MGTDPAVRGVTVCSWFGDFTKPSRIGMLLWVLTPVGATADYPSGQRGLTVNQLAYAYIGSNPISATTKAPSRRSEGAFRVRDSPTLLVVPVTRAVPHTLLGHSAQAEPRNASAPQGCQRRDSGRCWRSRPRRQLTWASGIPSDSRKNSRRTFALAACQWSLVTVSHETMSQETLCERVNAAG